MAGKYTLREVCRLLQADNKTVQGWLDEAGMKPQKDAGDKRRKLLSRAQVEHLATLHGRTLPPDSPVKAADPLAEMEQRLRTFIKREVAAQIAALRSELAAQHPMPPAVQPPPASTPPARPTGKGSARRQTPTLAWALVSRHGVPESVYQQWHAIPLTPRDALEYARRQGQRLHPCQERACPCHTLLSEN